MSAVSSFCLFFNKFHGLADSRIDCGNALQNGGAPAPDGNALCNMACDGNSAETCGAPNQLDVYSSSSGSSPTTTTASSPSATGNPLSGWTFLGCYTDNVSERALPMMEPVSRGVTNEGCQNACLAAGYSIAGTKYAGECCRFLFLILLLLSLIACI